jgi:hypothetical protein
MTFNITTYNIEWEVIKIKKLTMQQENLQLMGIIGADTVNKLLKQEIKNGVTNEVNSRQSNNSQFTKLKRVK